MEGSEGRQGWGSTGPISEGNTGPVPEDPRAPLNGRRGLDGHEGVSEKSVCTSSVGLKANALVLLGPGAQTWGLRWGSLSAPEVAGNSLLHLHPLANPTGQQRQLNFSWGPCCPDRPGRSRRQGDEAMAARTAAMAKAALTSHPHQGALTHIRTSPFLGKEIRKGYEQAGGGEEGSTFYYVTL